MSADEQRCDICRFYAVHHSTYYRCLRYPPQITSRETRYGGGLSSAWPETLPNAWCGEFSPLRLNWEAQ